MTTPDVYTTGEAAEYLRVKVDRIRRLRRQGEIRAVNVGTLRRPEWRFTQSALNTFLRERTV